MSILKNLKKKKEGLDLVKMNQMISEVNKLIEMKLLKVDLSAPKFFIHQELWSGKDQLFKNNWSKSVALFWNASTGMEGSQQIFQICDIENGEILGTYDFKSGFNETVHQQAFHS